MNEGWKRKNKGGKNIEFRNYGNVEKENKRIGYGKKNEGMKELRRKRKYKLGLINGDKYNKWYRRIYDEKLGIWY